MKIIDITRKYRLSYMDFIIFLKNETNNGSKGIDNNSIDDELVEKYVQQFLESDYNKSSTIDIETLKKEIKNIEEDNNAEYSRNNSPQYNQIPNNMVTGGSKNNESEDLNCRNFDIALQINNVRILGICSFIIAFLNPILSIIFGLIGKNMGKSISYVPESLSLSKSAAIRYNERGITLSIIFIIIDVVLSIIGGLIFFIIA